MDLKIHVSKKNFYWIKWSKIIFCSVLIGFVVGLVTLMFKNLVEEYEHILFSKAQSTKVMFFVLPLMGLGLIYCLRLFVFHNRKNKGISEVLEAVHFKKKLPAYKIPSHFFNGFLTVIFGGATGIEVSTVVATAAMGDLASKKEPIFKKYKKEFMGAAVATGISILFCSPLAGFFFSYENIKKQNSNVFWISHAIGVSIAVLLMFLFDVQPLFELHFLPKIWHLQVLPYFFIISLLAGIYGVYMTKIVLFSKQKFPFKNMPVLQFVTASILIGSILFVFPHLYGDGYHTLKSFTSPQTILTFSTGLLMVLVLIKPWITGITLAGGGDGGVFAPSIFGGACLGLMIGIIVKTYFYDDVVLINFVIMGIALTVSATLHAPFTAVFLTCGIFNNYSLILPLLIFVFVSFIVSKKIYPFTVYSISLQKQKR